MATINLNASGGNDTAAVQAAINSASAGDVLNFAAGDYNLDTVTLKSGVTYRGESGAALHATGDSPIFDVDGSDSHDIAIDSLTFVGTGGDPTEGAVNLSGDLSADSVSNISITNSSFVNNGVFFVGLKGSTIEHNSFQDIGDGGAAVFGYQADNTSISSNEIHNVYQGMSLIFGGGDGEQGRNVVVSGNVGEGISRMGIEIQGQDPDEPGETTNLLVQGNHFTNWTNTVDDGNTIAYSIVTDGGIGSQVLGNYAQGNLDTGIGIEISGEDALVSGNYIDGFDGAIIGYSPNETITGNNTINQAGGATISDYGAQDITISGNTSDPSMPIPEVGSAGPVAGGAADTVATDTAGGTDTVAATDTGGADTAGGTDTVVATDTGGADTADGTDAVVATDAGGADTADGTDAVVATDTGGADTADGTDAVVATDTGGADTADGTDAVGAIDTGGAVGTDTGGTDTAGGTDTGGPIDGGGHHWAHHYGHGGHGGHYRDGGVDAEVSTASAGSIAGTGSSSEATDTSGGADGGAIDGGGYIGTHQFSHGVYYQDGGADAEVSTASGGGQTVDSGFKAYLDSLMTEASGSIGGGKAPAFDFANLHKGAAALAADTAPVSGAGAAEAAHAPEDASIFGAAADTAALDQAEAPAQYDTADAAALTQLQHGWHCHC